MIIKTFRAETSSAALKRVREEMGGDAIVLKTTQESGALGRIIYEVTACLENPTVGQSSKIFPDENKSVPAVEKKPSVPSEKEVQANPPSVDVVSGDIWQKRYEKLELKINTFLNSDTVNQKKDDSPFSSVVEQLNAHDVSQAFIKEFRAELEESYDGSDDVMIFAKLKLAEKIIQYTTDDFSLEIGDKLAVVGPAGAGKSSIMGKLAASLVIKEKKKVTLLTLDDVKMGAYDETAAYAEILGADYADNRTAVESSHNNETITLIDTVATPQIIENIVPINDKLDAIGTTYRLAVFSAIMRSKDVAAMTEQMQAIHPTHLVITKTDMTDCLGTLITAAHSFDLKIVYTTDSPGGIGELHTPQVEKLVNEILQVEAASE